MMQNEARHTEIENYRLTPARWELVRQDAMMRARQARSQTLRDFARWIAALGAAAIESFRTWRRQRTAAFELQSLDDRSLRDIGINRSEIQSVVTGWDATRIRRGQLARARVGQSKKACKMASAPSPAKSAA